MMQNDSSQLSNLIMAAVQCFDQQFASSPTVFAMAPGRVNLIGEHIDYCGGYVLPMAVERHVAIAARPKGESSKAVIHSASKGETITIDLARIPEPPSEKTGHWQDYICGVIAGYMKLDVSIPGSIRGFEAVILADIPAGAGLSSSAALEVATASLIEAMTDHELDPKDKALRCQQVEHDFVGVPCGIMDQFSSVYGKQDHLLLIDCQHQTVQAIPFEAEDLSILITNSQVKHQLAESGYADRRREMEAALADIQAMTGKTNWRDIEITDVDRTFRSDTPNTETLLGRARHIVTEIARTQAAAKAVCAGKWQALGHLMYASHLSLKNDYEVSCPELDLLVAIAESIGTAGGVYGSRMTGGGFGGSTVSLIKRENAEEIIERISKAYEQETGMTPKCFTSRPANGARTWKA